MVDAQNAQARPTIYEALHRLDKQDPELLKAYESLPEDVKRIVDDFSVKRFQLAERQARAQAEQEAEASEAPAQEAPEAQPRSNYVNEVLERYNLSTFSGARQYGKAMMELAWDIMGMPGMTQNPLEMSAETLYKINPEAGLKKEALDRARTKFKRLGPEVQMEMFRKSFWDKTKEYFVQALAGDGEYYSPMISPA